MLIFLISLISVIIILFVAKRAFNSAKRNLFKDQAAWSGKEIKIKHKSAKEVTNSKNDENYLRIISEESTKFLEEEEKEDKESEIKHKYKE